MVNSLVERATSDMLIGPDWAMNIEISDMLNRDPGQAKDIVKGIKKRIGSRNPKVQLLALTLLETIIKNCGDIVHMHVAEKNVLQEMVRIVKKKPDHQVKEKVLILIDNWQDAFGGPRARYPQYYAAYQELLRAGAVFPQRSDRAAAPIFTPPQSHPLSSYSENVHNPGHDGARVESSADAEYPTLSLSELQNARGSMDVLAEMLNAIDPGNKEGLRQEALTDLVEQCRTYKQRVVHLVNSTADESLLCQGLAMNDDLQRVLAKYESLVSGTPVEAEKSKPEPVIRDLVDVDSPSQRAGAGESSKQTNERSTLGANTSTLVPISAPPAAKGSASTPKADPKMDLLSGDLLGGDDYSSPMQNSLALVPVSAPQPPSPVASEQNALALVDMFSAGSSTQTPLNAPPAFSAGPEFQQQQPLHPQQPSLYQNGMTPNMGSPYEQSGLPQVPGPSWDAQSVQLQQQPSTPAFGMQNGSSLPPPPWELQTTEAQPVPNAPTMQVSTISTPHLQPMQPPGIPTAGNEQVSSMYMQPITGGQLPATNQSFQMPMYPQQMQGAQMPGMIPQPMQPTQMTSMYPQQMYGNQVPGYGYQMPGYGNQMAGYGNQMAGYGNQMAGYGNQMAAYGYGSYGQQQNTQYLDQRMYGLSVKDDSALRGSTSSQTSMSSYLPPMKKQSQGDDKLFGDLVNMAKVKPMTKTIPGRTGSM